MKRKGKFDAIIVETTGLADPAPVAQTFFIDQDVAEKTRLDAVVTVADAKWLLDRLKDAPEAKNQIAFADVIVLNKIDLVNAEQLAEVEGRIRSINPYARLHKTTKAGVDIKEVLGRNAFDLDRILDLEPAFLEADEHDHAGHHTHSHDHAHHHHDESCGCGHDHADHDHDHGHTHPQKGLKHYHDETMQSLSVTVEGDLDPEKFMPWINEIAQKEGPSLLRWKGIVSLKDEPKRFVFQGVHIILDGDLQREWKPGETRASRVVFIGHHLKADELKQGFLACAA